MYRLILLLIYLVFIGLGSADALFGSAWPTIQVQTNVPLSYAGIVTMLIFGSIISATLLSARLVKRFGPGPVITIAVFTSAMALLGFSFATSFWMLVLLAIPLGLAGGSMDAAINNYAAQHYTSKHMSWLHCFWGVGAVISPLIMRYALSEGGGWNSGYRIVFVIQISIATLLLLSQPLWRKQGVIVEENHEQTHILRLPEILRIKGVKNLLLAFFAYCALEGTAILWASTFLVQHRDVPAEVAAGYAALFFIGITAGRFISGFVADKLGDWRMIRLGIAISLVGIIAVWLPISSNWLALNGLIVIGLGCAPIFPAIIHSTPKTFGKENAKSIIGVQMASAYSGVILMPPLFGLIATHINVGLFPIYLLIMAVLMLVMVERVNRIARS